MKKLVIVTIALVCALAIVLCIPVQAGNLKNPMPASTYESYRIKQGDTLTSIAKKFNSNPYMDSQEYIDKLVRVNRLTDETIHAGCYLTVIRF